MSWAVTIDFVATESAGIPELGLIAAEWNPPGPGPERFTIYALMKRPDIQNPSSARFMSFIARADTEAGEWLQSQTWSSADSPTLETALEAVRP